MERKHQVFVSSTYKDLIEERKEVIHALLELDCIPSGMELFPATDEDAWSLITEIIDGCDYYLLIIAGKYGSTNKDGVGYTEMEFDYAISQGKPVISFLHEDIESLTSSKVERSEKGKEALHKFSNKAKEKHCKYWSSAPDLGGKVSRSLVQLKKRHPSDGWVPGRYAVDQKMLSEYEKMRTRIIQLEAELVANIDGPPNNIDELSHGEDTYPITYKLKSDKEGDRGDIQIEPTWDKIFSYCGAALTGECTTVELIEKIRLVYWHSLTSNLVKLNSYDDIHQMHICTDQITVQLQALGLMEHGAKKRAVSDKNTYWKLTPYGERYLIQVRAIKRTL